MPKNANDFKPVVPPAPPSADKAALKAKLQEMRAQKARVITVTVNGEPLRLEARKPKGRDNWRLQRLGFDASGEDGKSQMVPEKFWPELIAATFYVPGSDERMWTDTEVGEIGDLPGDVVRELGTAALDFAGLSAAADEVASGNSAAAAAGGASSSTSPAS